MGAPHFGSAPRNWGKNVTLLASMSSEGMGPSLAVEGATTRAVFEAYVQKAGFAGRGPAPAKP
jgi:hypothetical protein